MRVQMNQESIVAGTIASIRGLGSMAGIEQFDDMGTDLPLLIIDQA
jgi:4-aminobutyrate aminotransferase-like enzyme